MVVSDGEQSRVGEWLSASESLWWSISIIQQLAADADAAADAAALVRASISNALRYILIIPAGLMCAHATLPSPATTDIEHNRFAKRCCVGR